jgi:hypothetical protein
VRSTWPGHLKVTATMPAANVRPGPNLRTGKTRSCLELQIIGNLEPDRKSYETMS